MPNLLAFIAKLTIALHKTSLRSSKVWQNRLKWHAFGGTRLPLDTKDTESWLHWTVPSSTPQRRTRTIHVFHPGSNNENEFTIPSPFHTTRVLRNTLLQYQVQSAEFKQRN